MTEVYNANTYTGTMLQQAIVIAIDYCTDGGNLLEKQRYTV